MDSIAYSCSLIVAATFCFAGVLKAIQPAAFARELGDYSLLPRRLLPIAAILIPALEVTGAILIIVPATHRLGAGLLLGLLGIFTAAVARNLLIGRTAISCACFGAASRELDVSIPLRNTLLAIGASLALVAPATVVTGSGAVIAFLGATLAWITVEAVKAFSGLREAAG